MTETVGCISIKSKAGQKSEDGKFAESKIKNWLCKIKQEGKIECSGCPKHKKEDCYREKLEIVMCSSISGYFDFQIICRTKKNADMGDLELFVQYCIRNYLSEFIIDTQTIIGIEIP